MSLEKLLDIGKNEGAVIDKRLNFQHIENFGISSFINSNSQVDTDTNSPITIQIPNSLIIKPDDAFDALNIDSETLQNIDRVSIFKFYIACLHIGVISNAKFKSYIDLLPSTTDIRSPLSMPLKSLYVFENTILNETAIKEKLESLKSEFLKVCSYNSEVGFDDYLWAHLIITSRAFPYKIVNPNAKLYEVMLLPIIDLLNHKPHSKVEWSSNSVGDFKLSILDIPSNGGQVFNNYGPKGNAELLMGYGFILENNEFDSLQLSLSLDDNLKHGLLNDWNLKLPTIHDFMQTVVDINEETELPQSSVQVDTDKTVFMLNQFHSIPDGLLELFCYISKNEDDKGMTLKNVMNGLNKLKQSLEVKFMQKLDKMPPFDESLISAKDYENAKIFRQGQLKIYNLAKSNIKSMEKKYLKDYRKNFITIKDIIKKDNEFEDFVHICQWDKPIDQLGKIEMELLLRLWMMKNINYWNIANVQEFSHFDIKWFLILFNNSKESANDHITEHDDEFMVDLYNQIIPPLKKHAPELIKNNFWTLKDWLLVDNLIIRNSYEKGKTQEPLLIKPKDLF